MMNFIAQNRALFSAAIGLLFTVGGLYLFGWSLLVVQIFLLIDFLSNIILDILKVSKIKQHSQELGHKFSLLPVGIISFLGLVACVAFIYLQIAPFHNGFSSFWSELNADMGWEIMLFPLFFLMPFIEFKMDFLMFARHRKIKGDKWAENRLFSAGIPYLALLLTSFFLSVKYAEWVLVGSAIIKFIGDFVGIRWEEKQRS